METELTSVLETIEFPKGMVVDLEEGFRKISARQFADPARAFSEVIQNLIDSYPSDVPWEKRTGEIETSRGTGTISITDYGEGFSLVRIRLLMTLGGTDKAGVNTDKIGQFGVGFFSLFNPRLGTREVTIVTRCQGETVLLRFLVHNPEIRPEVSARILDEKIPFSTRVEIRFERENSVEDCVRQARESLRYYPCRVTIDGRKIKSVWDEARKNGARCFHEGACTGFIQKTLFDCYVTVLCKYEYIMTATIGQFSACGHFPKYDLRDFELMEMPYLPGFSATVNSNHLRVTLDRQGFYSGPPYMEMARILAHNLLLVLEKRLSTDPDPELIVTNLYILRQRFRPFIDEKHGRKKSSVAYSDERVLMLLLESKIFRVKEQKQLFSLAELKKMHSPELPLFYCFDLVNSDWLGGSFKHDFILLLQKPRLGHGAPNFFQELLGAFFKEPLNLDDLPRDRKKVQELVSRGIIHPSSLKPDVRMREEGELTASHLRLLEEMDDLLDHEGVRAAIAAHLHLNAVSIRCAFFQIHNWGIDIAAGIFNRHGEVITDELITNLRLPHEEGRNTADCETPVELLLGINVANPLIEVLCRSSNPYRSAYGLIMIARELTMAQFLLTPFSSFYHSVRGRLANELLEAMLERMVSSA